MYGTNLRHSLGHPPPLFLFTEEISSVGGLWVFLKQSITNIIFYDNTQRHLLKPIVKRPHPLKQKNETIQTEKTKPLKQVAEYPCVATEGHLEWFFCKVLAHNKLALAFFSGEKQLAHLLLCYLCSCLQSFQIFQSKNQPTFFVS